MELKNVHIQDNNVKERMERQQEHRIREHDQCRVRVETTTDNIRFEQVKEVMVDRRKLRITVETVTGRVLQTSFLNLEEIEYNPERTKANVWKDKEEDRPESRHADDDSANLRHPAIG